jgi:hypothetical protein
MSVTAVTTNPQHPLGLTLWAQKKTHVYPYHYRIRPPPKVVTVVTAVMTLMRVIAELL